MTHLMLHLAYVHDICYVHVIMNTAHFMNIQRFSSGELERALAAKLEELLGSVDWLRGWRVAPAINRTDAGFDLRASLPLPGGREAILYVECKSELRPGGAFALMQRRAFLPAARQKLVIPVLALPWVSPRMAELCKENNWCWFDLAGNYWLDVPGSLHLEHTGNAPVYKRQTPMASLSTREANRVMRVFLQPKYAQTRWTQRELQKHCWPEVSLGLINRVVRRLRDEAYIEAHSRGGFRLRDPLKLLFAWRDMYRFDRHERRGYFTLLQGKIQRDALAELGLRRGVSVLYAAFSAAELQAPHVRQPKTWIYVRDRDIPAFEKLIEARSVDSGENLTVLIPDDEGVRYMCEDGTAGYNGLGCTNIVQTYVDLWHCGGRGKEAADALLEQRLKPAWKKHGVL